MIALVVLSISVPSSIFYYVSKGLLVDQVDQYLNAELAKYSYDINGWLYTQAQAVVIIGDIVQKEYEKQDITKEFLHSYRSNGNISDIYIGFSDGSFLSAIGWQPEEGYDPRNRPWYQEVMQSGKLNISNVYFDFTSQQYAVAIGIPLKDKNGKTIGVLSEDILLDTLYDKIKEIQLKNLGYAYLMDTEGKIIVHKDQSLIGEDFNELIKNGIVFDSEIKAGKGKYTYQGETRLVVYDSLKNTHWRLVLVVKESQVYKPLYRLLLIYLVTIIIALIVASIVLKIFNGNIVRRLKMLSDASLALSKGNFDTEIADLGKDEVGEVSKAFERMKTEIKEKIDELDSSRVKYEELIENTVDVIFSIDREGYLITANSGFFDTFGTSKEVLGKEKFKEIVNATELGNILLLLIDEVIQKKQQLNHEIDDIENRYFNVTISPIFDKRIETVKGATVILHDSSDIKQYRNNLEWVSHHDVLTQLPNRFKLMEDMDSILWKANMNQSSLAVVLIDLDDFKSINDTLGYLSGDIILKRVAEILQDKFISYRIGADEFAVVVDAYSNHLELQNKVEEISKLLHYQFELELNTVYLSATLGVVVYPQDFSDIHEMMIHMDAALNYAKKNKKSAIQYYENFISRELEDRVILEKGLRRALDSREFVLFYQPIMDCRTGKIKGMEALIRWQRKDGRLISPGEFMPVAENMSIIHEIGIWVIKQAILDLKKLQTKGNKDFTMAINLSANQIKMPDFCEKVIEIITTEGVDPQFIEFEITESVLIESMELARKQFQKLIDFGAKISLDDFGTGFSSLNYIQYFPFDILKIDKSFIGYINEDTIGKSLVKHIIEIAHSRNMKIVAEGVETELQQTYLLERECDYIQGYLFSKPLSLEDFYHFIQKQEK